MNFANTNRGARAFRLIEPLVVIAIIGLLGGSSRSDAQAMPERPSAAAWETRPVLVSGVAVDRLAGEVVCIYNFSSW